MKDSHSSDKIIFSQTDPLGNEIILKSSTLDFHIAGTEGDHPERSWLYIPYNLAVIKNIIASPTFVFADKIHDNRLNYFDLVTFEGHTSLKTVKIVTESTATKLSEVVTIIPLGATKSEKFDGRKIYDRHGPY